MTKILLLSLSWIVITINLYSQVKDTSLTKYKRDICFDNSKEDIQESIKYFTEIVKNDSNDLDAYYNLGMSYYKLLNFKKAIEIYDLLIKKDSCFNYALHNRALCKFFLKDREGACEDLKKALQCCYPDMTATKEDYERLCK